jgi:hypothetical protein
MSDKVKVIFRFKKNVVQFLQTNQPELLIKADGLEKLFLMERNELTLELPRKFNLTFRVPYMGQYAFKVERDFNLANKNHFEVTFYPKIFVFNPAKIVIE